MDQLQDSLLNDLLKKVSRKPDVRNQKVNPWNEDRRYLEIKLVQDTLDKIFPVRDELVENEFVEGNAVHVTIRLVTPLGSRDGFGSAIVREDRYTGKVSGYSMIEARRIARSMALKNAAASFGRVFGRDIIRDQEEEAYKVKIVNE